MSHKEIKLIVREILIKHFKIKESNFQWDIPLEILQQEFNLLSILLDLEEHLNKAFNKTISLAKTIEVGIHTPSDIVLLIKDQF